MAARNSTSKHKRQMTAAQKRTIYQSLLKIEKTNSELQLGIKRVLTQVRAGTFGGGGGGRGGHGGHR